MKKLLFTAITLLTITLTQAQDEPGFTNADIFISGSLSFTSNSIGDVENTGFSIAPRLGYFVTENVAIGGRLGYGYSSRDQDADISIETNTFEIGAFGRYYFTPATKFSVFSELNFNYQNIKQELPSIESKTRGFNVAAGVGINYFMSKNFALEALWAGLSYASLNPEQGESNDIFQIGVNLDNISLGLIYKF